MLLALVRHNAPILFIINWYNYLNFKNRLKQGGGICCWPRWGTMPLSLSGSCLCLWCATQLLASDNIEPLFRPTLGGAGITFCNKRPFNLFPPTADKRQQWTKDWSSCGMIVFLQRFSSQSFWFTRDARSALWKDRLPAPKNQATHSPLSKFWISFTIAHHIFLIFNPYNHRDMTKNI